MNGNRVPLSITTCSTVTEPSPFFTNKKFKVMGNSRNFFLACVLTHWRHRCEKWENRRLFALFSIFYMLYTLHQSMSLNDKVKHANEPVHTTYVSQFSAVDGRMACLARLFTLVLVHSYGDSW